MPPPPAMRPPRRPLGRGPGAAGPAGEAGAGAGAEAAPDGPEAVAPDAVAPRDPVDRGEGAGGPAPEGAEEGAESAGGAGGAREGVEGAAGAGSAEGGAGGARGAEGAAESTEDAAGGATGSAAEAAVDGAVDVPADVAGVRGAGGGAGEAGGPVQGADGDERRFTVRLANFEGPFDLLLQLISKHRLDVTEVALSQVTDEFLAHLRAMGPEGDLDQTTEFLVVAATLLDLKAARLLPAAEVEDEADLALLEARDLLFARLLQYRAYKRVADIFGGRLESEARRYPRTVGLEPHHAELLPEVVITIGAEGFARLAVKAMQPKPPPQVYVDHIHAPLVSVREQAALVVARLRAGGQVSFEELAGDAGGTLTVVARFLALLELYRERAVALDQDEALGPLLVRWTGGDGGTGAEPVVTDEFDRPPGEPEPGREKEREGTA
ncbi:ScpA family protein [Streptomyces sp. NPDC093085]|uniref:segregation and condensation protein A n=1 Tax=Streptomyces sp. NPDC093085 TaxID=3155068 RepID=UPI0034282792